MSKELEVAIEAAKKAGKISMKYFGGKIQFEKKQDGSPVTAADKECEKAIIETIRDSCGTELKEALTIQAKHSAEFMISDSCNNGRIGAEFKRLMDV